MQKTVINKETTLRMWVLGARLQVMGDLHSFTTANDTWLIGPQVVTLRGGYSVGRLEFLAVADAPGTPNCTTRLRVCRSQLQHLPSGKQRSMARW